MFFKYGFSPTSVFLQKINLTLERELMKFSVFCVIGIFALLANFFFNSFALANEPNTVKCVTTRDVWLSSANKDEINTNGGKSSKIKLKIYQEFGLLDFDVSALKGKKIEKAVLYVAIVGAGLDKARGSDLRWFTLSTVSSDWVEGEGKEYDIDEAGKGATFNEASYKTKPWSYPGSRCWDVILGNGNTLRYDVDGGDPKDGWFAIPVDNKLIEALITKSSYGLLLMDGSTGVDRNCTIASRENKKSAPYLMVTVAGDDLQAPTMPTNLIAKPSPNDASDTTGAITLAFQVPEKAFAYQIKINDQEIPRWQIPFAKPNNKVQEITLEYLPPDTDLNIELYAIDRAGNVSPVAKTNCKSSPKITVPKLPKGNFSFSENGIKNKQEKLKIWAFPDICKLDPIKGKIILEPNMENAAIKNSIWEEKTSTIRLVAAKGEIIGFQLALEAPQEGLKDIKVKINGLNTIQTRFWRTWHVKHNDIWQPEYAIPMKEGASLALPSTDLVIPNQKFTSIAIDLIVPEEFKSGEHTGNINISAEGNIEVNLALNLKVFNVNIPKEINFNPELNCYGGPGTAGSELWFDSFKLAHYHRSTINRVPYNQAGKTHEDYIPKIDESGKVIDWANFDKNLGPLLDGSAFKNNPRANVPVATLYLPHNENWPMPLIPHYAPGVPLEGANWKAIHDIKAKTPEKAFSKVYQEAFSASVSEFAKHFDEKGWTNTICEFYFNNKFNPKGMNGTAWVLDEPAETLDWLALNFYSQLARKGFKSALKSKFVFRGDVSRPMWQGSISDGLMEVMYVNSEMYSFLPLVKDQKKRMPTILFNYGEANHISRVNHETTAWCIKAYINECDGVLPWQSLGGDAAFDVGDSKGGGNALIVNGSKRFGVNAIGSYRMHALRNGAQICELLRLLEIKNKWGRAHSKAIVSQVLTLSSEFKQGFSDDAAAITFKSLSGDQFVALKEGLLILIEN